MISTKSFSLTLDQQEVFSVVMSVYGKIDKHLHKRFWKDIKNRNEIAKYLESSGITVKITRDSLNYSKELWKSALVSYDQKQVYQSENYLKAKKELNNFINITSNNIPNLSERAQVVNQMKISMINSKSLLESAAAHKPLVGAQGITVQIDREKIVYILNNLEKSFLRIEKLLDPVWKD